MSSGGASLEARGLGIRFQGLSALSDVSFTVPPGQIRGLIGPNGAGKTTMFNCITGFYRATSGSVLVDGQPIDGLRPHEISTLGISRTFQNIRLFANMTALENILASTRLAEAVAHPRHATGNRLVDAARQAPFAPKAVANALGEIGAAVLRLPATRRTEKTAVDRGRSLLRMVGLPGRENMIARNLPYGDQRRLEIARALATNPRLLLLDEPTAGMNPGESVEMTALIRRLRDELGLTLILIEHQMRVVMGVCDEITVLDYGRKIAEGSPAEVQRNPIVIEAYLGTRAAGESHAAP